MRKDSIKVRVSAIALTLALAGSSAVLTKPSEKDYYLETTPIEQLLEDEDIQNLTTLDEELDAGTINILVKDAKFRKKIIDLNYYASSGEEDLYNETLNWLRENFEDTATEILLYSAKGAIADEEKVSINSVTLTPAPDYNEDTLFLTPKGTAEVKKDFQGEGYTIKSKPMNKAINLSATIQDMNFNEMNAKDIVNLYDEVIETSKMTIASGVSRYDDKIKAKNSKRYIKKNFNI